MFAVSEVNVITAIAGPSCRLRGGVEGDDHRDQCRERPRVDEQHEVGQPGGYEVFDGDVGGSEQGAGGGSKDDALTQLWGFEPTRSSDQDRTEREQDALDGDQPGG